MSGRALVVVRCVLAGALVASITACQAGEQKGTTLTESDGGKTITIKRSESMQVVLVRDPHTDLDWETTAYDQKLLRPRQVIQHTAGSPPPPSDKVFLEFEALAKGTTTLQVAYHQRAHPEIPPLKTFEVTVTIE